MLPSGGASGGASCRSRALPQLRVDAGHAVATRVTYILVPLTASADGCRPTSIRSRYASVPRAKNAGLRQGAAAPSRDEHLTVRRERDATRVMIGRKPLRDLAARSVHRCEPIADVLGDIKEFSVGRHRQVRRIDCAGAVLCCQESSRRTFMKEVHAAKVCQTLMIIMIIGKLDTSRSFEENMTSHEILTQG